MHQNAGSKESKFAIIFTKSQKYYKNNYNFYLNGFEGCETTRNMTIWYMTFDTVFHFELIDCLSKIKFNKPLTL